MPPSTNSFMVVLYPCRHTEFAARNHVVAHSRVDVDHVIKNHNPMNDVANSVNDDYCGMHNCGFVLRVCT